MLSSGTIFPPSSLSGTTIFLFYIYFRSCDQGLNPNHYRTIPVPFPFHYRGYPRLYLIHYRTLVGLFAHKICSCKSGKNGKVPHFILIRLVPFLTKLVPFLPPKGTSLLFPSLYWGWIFIYVYCFWMIPHFWNFWVLFDIDGNDIFDDGIYFEWTIWEFTIK